jgi:hypothetical protein
VILKKGEFSMKIEIIGAESLGVRGLCCLVTVAERKILIDPGLALGFLRNGQAPHPVQVAMGEVIRKQIIQAWGLATDIVFSHFHGDHVPLVDANPYQLDATLAKCSTAGRFPWNGTSSMHKGRLPRKNMNKLSLGSGSAGD